jgi:hypothetical protein
MANLGSTLQALDANAGLVLSAARDQLGQTIGYDDAGVKWLDGYVQRLHERGDPAIWDGLVDTLGSYLGKCIIETYGGSWGQVEGRWCVVFDENNIASPFTKIEKQLTNGSVDSVYSFFTVIPLVFKDVLHGWGGPLARPRSQRVDSR